MRSRSRRLAGALLLAGIVWTAGGSASADILPRIRLFRQGPYQGDLKWDDSNVVHYCIRNYVANPCMPVSR
jgi:hypothetical protein